MSREERSRGACWTCRLRRKKCDEIAPVCSACTSLTVPCFGYDKPAWADGGMRQKAKWEELQVIIRELASMRRRRRQQAVRNGKDAAERFDEACSDMPITNVQIEGTDLEAATLSNATTETTSVEIQSLAISESCYNSKTIISDFLARDSQAHLLMHYLDVVFPNQFPFYNPQSSEGGRGWLLLFILRTKPLYHAALSMAAYHQQTHDCELFRLQALDCISMDKLLSHHSLAIKELRNHLEGFRKAECSQSLQGNTEVLACIVFLICLEVYLGDTQSWQIHLHAAQTLLPGLGKGCRGSPHPDEPFSPTHKKAYQFFTGVIAWFDILSAATTGITPWAPRMCLDEEQGFIQLETVMGCENSVILSIMEVASLDEWKSTSQMNSCLDLSDLVNRATRIENGLADVLKQCSRSFEQLATSEPPTENDQPESKSVVWNEQLNDPALVEATARKANTSAITHIFACAALVHLNVVVYGPIVEHAKLRGSVSRAISAFRELRDRTALGILAWPLCVVGCMATGWQIDFFKDLSLQFEKVSDVKSGNLKRSILIMEECWRMRKEGTETTAPYWKDAMESLDMKVLLI